MSKKKFEQSDPKHLIGFLKFLSNNIAIRFLCPIYLVGSYVDNRIDALDIDIIIVMTNERHMRLFKSKYWNKRKFRFCNKQKKYFEDHVSDWDFDVKVQTLSQFREIKKKRIKLDTIMRGPR